MLKVFSSIAKKAKKGNDNSGISQILEHNKPLKVSWIIILLLSMFIGLASIFISLLVYFKYDVLTKVETTATLVFPSVTFCVQDQFEKLQGEGIWNGTNDNISIKRFISEKGSRFKGNPLNVDQLESFKIPKLYTNCVRLNGMSKKAIRDSLVIEFMIVSKTETDTYKVDILKGGFEVYIGDNALNSFLNASPLRLEYNNYHSIDNFKVDVTEKLGKPYSDCVASGDQYYRQMNCLEKCVSAEIRDAYNCTIPSYYVRANDDLERCANFTFFPTVGFSASCEAQCPRECESTDFSLMVSQFQVNYYEHPLHLATFKISVSQMTAMKMTEVPRMTAFDLFANIGGISVFFSLSIPSIVQVLEFIYHPLLRQDITSK